MLQMTVCTSRTYRWKLKRLYKIAGDRRRYGIIYRNPVEKTLLYTIKQERGFIEAYKEFHAGLKEYINKRKPEALVHFKKAIKECEYFPSAYLWAGIVSKELNKKEEAEEYFRNIKQTTQKDSGIRNF